MPNYEYHCDVCDVEFEAFTVVAERHNVRHESCGGPARKVIRTVQKPKVFRAGFFPHLDHKPVYAGSKQQLKDECNRRDKFMPYAWD